MQDDIRTREQRLGLEPRGTKAKDYIKALIVSPVLVAFLYVFFMGVFVIFK
jgi:hypothetical protein